MDDNKLLEKLSEMLDQKLEEKLERKFDEKLVPVYVRLDDLGERVDKLDGKVEVLGEQFKVLDGRVEVLEEHAERMDGRVRKIGVQIEGEVLPRLQTIEKCYVDTAERYLDSTADMDTLRNDMTVVKEVVKNHSKKLQNIS